MQRASASRKSSSKKSVTLLARGMKGDVKHGANYRFKVVLFGANCWKSQKSSSPTQATFILICTIEVLNAMKVKYVKIHFSLFCDVLFETIC